MSWEEGKTYFFNVAFRNEMEIHDLNGNQLLRQTEVDRQLISFAVSRKDDSGGKVLLWNILKLDGEVFQNGRRTDHYSTDDSPELAALFIGKTLRYQLDNNGALVDIEGTEEINKKLKEESNVELHGVFDAMFSEDTLAERFRQTFEESIPSKDAAVGESWQYESETDNGQLGVMVSSLTFTFDGVKEADGIQTALITSDGTMAPKDGEIKIAGTEMTFLESSGYGSLKIDVNRKMLIKHLTVQNFKVEIQITEGIQVLTVVNNSTVSQSMKLNRIE